MLTKEENLARLDERISKLNIGGNKIIAFDFDELVISDHLTRRVAQEISENTNLDHLNNLGSCSFEGIFYLNSLWKKMSLDDYEKIRDKIVNETPWRDGFKELLEELVKSYSVIFISSGMKDIAESKLNEIGFDSRNILGGEVKISEKDSPEIKLVISDELKGYIIKKLRDKYRVIGIGHSKGDRFMLQESDVSIGFNPNVSDLAEHEVQTPQEILEIIKNN